MTGKMATAVQAIENWCTCLSLEEIDKYLTAMKMKTSGARFEKLNRASKWLLGDYSADDFIETDTDVDEHSEWVERANLRQTFVDRICNGEIETPWVQGSEENEPHPLESVREDDAVKIKLEQTRLEIASRVAEKSSLEQDDANDNDENAAGGETLANIHANSSPQTAQQHITTQETPNIAIPAELSMLLTQLTQKVTQLAENQSILHNALDNLSQNVHHAPAYSTRLEQTQSGHRQVGFQDTFTYRYPEQQNNTMHTPPMPRQQFNRPQQTPHNRLVGGAWEGGGLPNQTNSGGLRGNSNALDASTPRPNTPNRNNQRDVGNIARKWGLKFTGEKGQSIDVFLNRVEECRDLAKISEEEMLSSLSE